MRGAKFYLGPKSEKNIFRTFVVFITSIVPHQTIPPIPQHFSIYEQKVVNMSIVFQEGNQ